MARVIRQKDIFEELHNRYGTHIALRIQKELSPSEFNALALTDFANWLEVRAQTAHREYEAKLENPFLDPSRESTVSVLYRRWQGAEDLAFLISVAEGASPRRLVKAANSK